MILDMRIPNPPWLKFLQNPIAYVIAVLISAALAFLLPSVWWLPWLVSIAWGVSLLVLQLINIDEVKGDHRPELQVYLDRAQTYQAQIYEAIRTTSTKHDRARLQQLATQVNVWVEAVQALVERITNLQQNPIIRQDIVEVPKTLETLKGRLASETNLSLRTQLEQALAHCNQQFASLEELQNTIKQAEIQLEMTLSLLGTIYSQLLTSQSTHHVADYSRFSAEVDEQVHLLQDRLEALREVKLGGSQQ